MTDFDTSEIVEKLKKNKLLIPFVIIGAGLGLFVLIRTSSGNSNSLSFPENVSDEFTTNNGSNADNTQADYQSQFSDFSENIAQQITGLENTQSDFMSSVTDYLNSTIESISSGFNGNTQETDLSPIYDELSSIYSRISDIPSTSIPLESYNNTPYNYYNTPISYDDIPRYVSNPEINYSQYSDNKPANNKSLNSQARTYQGIASQQNSNQPKQNKTFPTISLRSNVSPKISRSDTKVIPKTKSTIKPTTIKQPYKKQPVKINPTISPKPKLSPIKSVPTYKPIKKTVGTPKITKK